MHLWNPPISLWIKYCFVKARYSVNKDLNFEMASLPNAWLQANPLSQPTLKFQLLSEKQQEEKYTTFRDGIWGL